MTIEFYAHYNPDTNRIEGVKQTDKTDGKLIAVKITEEQASKILIENCSVLDLTLGFSDQDEMSIVEKLDTAANFASKVDASSFVKLEEYFGTAEVTLKIFKDKLEVVLDTDIPFVKLGMSEITFNFTAKNDPTRLITRITVDMSELEQRSALEIPLFAALFSNNEPKPSNRLVINTIEDYRNCSVFVVKKFKSYKVEIQNE